MDIRDEIAFYHTAMETFKAVFSTIYSIYNTVMATFNDVLCAISLIYHTARQTFKALLCTIYSIFNTVMPTFRLIYFYVHLVGVKLIGHLKKILFKFLNYTPLTYLKDDNLTAVSKRRLQLVQRKALVVQMNQILISEKLQLCGMPSPLMPSDFRVQLPNSNDTLHIYKRPNLHLFLEKVSKWYNLVIFSTASEHYASIVLDQLDAGRNILKHRIYSNDCINFSDIRDKFISKSLSDLANVVLLGDYQKQKSHHTGNELHMKSYCEGTLDAELIGMLPFLDALRFTKDVRSILARNTGKQ